MNQVSVQNFFTVKIIISQRCPQVSLCYPCLHTESCVECIAARHSQANLERKEYSGARIYIRKIAMELTSAGPALVEDDQKGASEGLSKDTDPDFFQVSERFQGRDGIG